MTKLPTGAEPWPNGLGFDLGNLEFHTMAGGVRDIEAMTYGVGETWEAALADLRANPKECT